MSEKNIWDTLMRSINNPYGVAGLMGNLQAESGLKSNNVQNCYEKGLNMSDETYTINTDAGKYTNFVKDKVGYGLAQWTYWSRKQKLFDFMKERRVSVGDEYFQCEFLIHELSTSYKTVFNKLKNATSVRESSDVVLTQYEKPANQDENVKQNRARYGQTFFDRYANTTTDTSVVPVVPVVPVAPVVPTKPNYNVYVVNKGDSLWAIATKFYGSGNRYTEIKQLNNLTSNTIYAGQTLKIPLR